MSETLKKELFKKLEELNKQQRIIEKEKDAIKTLLGEDYKEGFQPELQLNQVEDIHEIKVGSKMPLAGNPMPFIGSPMPEHPLGKCQPKGKMSWMDYAYYLLEHIGGKGKVAEVVEPAILVNGDITKNRLRAAIGEKLSRLAKDGKIKATRGKSLKEGNLYEII